MPRNDSNLRCKECSAPLSNDWRGDYCRDCYPLLGTLCSGGKLSDAQRDELRSRTQRHRAQ